MEYQQTVCCNCSTFSTSSFVKKDALNPFRGFIELVRQNAVHFLNTQKISKSPRGSILEFLLQCSKPQNYVALGARISIYITKYVNFSKIHQI